MAIQTIKLGGFVDEEVKKINDNFAECCTGTIPTVPTNVSAFENDANYQNSTQVTNAINAAIEALDIPTDTSDLTNDAGYQTANQVANAIANKVDKISGKDLSSNDYTDDDAAKVAKLGKIDFTTSNFGTQQADGYVHATLSAAGKVPVKVMRANGSDYEEVLVHTKVSGNNIVVVAAEAFAGYVVTM